LFEESGWWNEEIVISLEPSLISSKQSVPSHTSGDLLFGKRRFFFEQSRFSS
jgi:hypothetical protein